MTPTTDAGQKLAGTLRAYGLADDPDSPWPDNDIRDIERQAATDESRKITGAAVDTALRIAESYERKDASEWHEPDGSSTVEGEHPHWALWNHVERRWDLLPRDAAAPAPADEETK